MNLSDYDTFDLGPLTLQLGLTLPKAHLAYKTYGTLASDKSNVILYPTSYGAHHSDIDWLIGRDRMLDPERYFIVIANQFGNGAGDIGALSATQPVKGIIFREVDPSYDYDFHNAPQRQYIILLDGEIEIETSLGEKKIFKTGDVILAEDTMGKGHKTKNLQSIKRRSIFITLP